MFVRGGWVKRNWNSFLCAKALQGSFATSLVNIHRPSQSFWSQMRGKCRNGSAAPGEHLTQLQKSSHNTGLVGGGNNASHISTARSRIAHVIPFSCCCNWHLKPLVSTKYKTSSCYFCAFKTVVSASRSHSSP